MSIAQAANSGLQTVQNGRGFFDTLANKYIVKPKNVKGIGGFVFDYEGETTLQLQSDITDHFTENNTAIQDHIAYKPIRMTLRGFVGELVLKKPEGILGALDLLQNGLTQVPGYLGHYTPQALGKVQAALTKAQSTVNTIDNAIAKVKNVVGFFTGASKRPTRQEQAYSQLVALGFPVPLGTSVQGPRKQPTFIVETPYGVFENMAMESLTLIQDETTKSFSDISIGLKQLRFVGSDVSTAGSETFGGRGLYQRQTNTDKGKTKGSDVPVSTLKQIFNPN